MKLRIKGNSLRLRLSRSEVDRLSRRERLEETIHFAPHAEAKLTYALEQASSVSVPGVRYSQGEITVLLPAALADTWCSTDLVGIAERVGLGALGSLELVIEKDFACLDRSEEENEDTFANPHAEAVATFERLDVLESDCQQFLMAGLLGAQYKTHIFGMDHVNDLLQGVR